MGGSLAHRLGITHVDRDLLLANIFWDLRFCPAVR